MNARKKSFLLFTVLSFAAFASLWAQEKPKFELPLAVASELRRLEETYHVLDFAAEKIWPGWKSYKDFPFMLSFENGLRLLIGHPAPPKEFELLPDHKIQDKNVYIDRTKLAPLEIKEPLSCGGGILPYGMSEGRPIQTVSMNFYKVPLSEKEDLSKMKTEDRILIYIHELFHCFQRANVQFQYGNLRYNSDVNYALYSEIEGRALEKAYAESDSEKAKGYLKDFIIARELKRKSMTEAQQKEESSDDVREGTAVYSEVRTLEILKEGYKPQLNATDDPYYGEFKDIDSFLKKYTERLKSSSENIYESKMKCYDYGCFQALLLQRFFPGWQEPFSKEACLMDDELRKRIPVSEEDKAGAQKRFQDVYNFEEIKARAQKAMEERDSAYKALISLKGKAYIISFKEVQQYVSAVVDKSKKSYDLGLIKTYPDGIGKIKFEDVEIDVHQKPAEVNQLFYIRLVDTEWKKRSKPYSLQFEKQESDSVYKNAVITNPLFTLKAPKVRIKDSAKRVKIWVLSRVREKE